MAISKGVNREALSLRADIITSSYEGDLILFGRFHAKAIEFVNIEELSFQHFCKFVFMIYYSFKILNQI